MTNKLTIEWQRIEKDGQTCDRCNKTKQNIQQAIEMLRKSPEGKELDIQLETIPLTPDRLLDSNSIRVNGKALEELFPEINVEKNSCESCSCLTEETAECRTYMINNVTHEDIPAEIIYQALLKALAV